ncbi:MAG: M20 family metallopeptidase [Methylotetracoccus sp.]|nr:M20 family metallopeptidase [Methylotetracoccus sp.]
MDPNRLERFVGSLWDDSIQPALVDYIRIPNKSPLFDPEWQRHGYMDDAVALAEQWCRDHLPGGASVDVVRLPGRTPVLFLEVPGNAAGTVLMYGHLDKQPEMSGWREGFGPWDPVVEGDKLYGRGGADDGYAVFASLTAVLAIREQGVPHPRCAILIECCEESGSFDLPHYVDRLAARIGQPDLVICLDSGCGNYDQLWLTTSLRGLVGGELTVEVLTEGVHSGDASGIVPSSFRIARQLIARLESDVTGEIINAFHAEIPGQRVEQAQQAADVLGEAVYTKFPFASGVLPAVADRVQLILNRTWRPALEITGASGLPAMDQAGNVLRPRTGLKLSLRLPPTLDVRAAAEVLQKILERDPPHGAHVSFVAEQSASGWNAPVLTARLAASIDAASRRYFGQPSVQMGEGGTIPFMAMLGQQFPEAQFLVTGVLGPHSNAHGPNEFLHLPTARKVTCCIAQLLAEIPGR